MPKRTGMTPAVIAAQALALIDELGLEGVSIRRLAAALDVSAMTVYSYFADRDALLDTVAQCLYAEIRPRPAGEDPRADLRSVMHAVRDVLRAHPRALGLVLQYPPHTPEAVTYVDAGYRALVAAGVSPEDAGPCYRALAAYSVGRASLETTRCFDASATLEAAQRHRPDAQSSSAQSTSGHHRRAHLMVADLDHDAEFDYGLDLTLDGFLSSVSSG